MSAALPPATPDLTDPRDGHVGQGAGQFGPAAPDGLLVHARDLRQQALATVPHPIRLQRRVPAPLPLIQATGEQGHLLVPCAVRMGHTLPAQWALTCRCDQRPGSALRTRLCLRHAGMVRSQPLAPLPFHSQTGNLFFNKSLGIGPGQ